MKSFTYNTDTGTFEIRQVSHELYELWMEDEFLGSYESAEFAAADVAAFNTGYNEWDRFKNEFQNIPFDISQWAKVTEETPPSIKG